MSDARAMGRLAGASALLAALAAAASIVVGLIAVGGDARVIAEPTRALALGEGAAPGLRWSMLLDLAGYYLLLGPIALRLRERLGPASPRLLDLYTLCGLGYVLIGAMGAAVLAAACPPLFPEVARGGAAERAAARIVYETLIHAVYGGLWNTLEMLLAGIWWWGVGLHLRADRRALGALTMALGAASLLDAAGTALGAAGVAQLGLKLYLVLMIVWAAWIGVDELRRPPAPA